MRDLLIPNDLYIPIEMQPQKGVKEVVDPLTGSRVLLENKVMFTAYQHAQGSLSERFFLPLRDGKIMGAQCVECGEIICPPYQLMCPPCNFKEMKLVELPDRGIMMASAPITLFGNAMFKSEVPFARGFVKLGKAEVWLNVRSLTTTGMISPGVFKKGTPVKVVFASSRNGLISDICLVPESELTEAQLSTSPLLSTDVNWKNIVRPEYMESSIAHENFDTFLKLLPQIQTEIAQSRRATQDLAGWNVAVQCFTSAGCSSLQIKDSNLKILTHGIENSTFDIATEDPIVFLHWWKKGKSLTNYIVDGTIWLSDPLGLETIFKLDRLPRSVKRDLLEAEQKNK